MNVSPVKVTILDKEYLISCEEHEKEPLRHAVDYLNKNMNVMKKTGNVIGSERIAVMTALNVVNELLAYKQENNNYIDKVDSTLKRLQNKIDSAIGIDKPQENSDQT